MTSMDVISDQQSWIISFEAPSALEDIYGSIQSYCLYRLSSLRHFSPLESAFFFLFCSLATLLLLFHKAGLSIIIYHH